MVKKKPEDPIVEEVRAAGLAFAKEHENDPHRMAEALRRNEALSGRKVVNRDPELARQEDMHST